VSRLEYAELVRSLFPRLTGGIRWGLERTARLLAAVDDPHRAYRTVHVGGTNGKGSVAVTIASVLREAGLRTGLYTSPHLCSFRERIAIDGEPVGEAALVAAAERLWPHVATESPSFFEATTAIGFLALAEAGVDVAVVEVGLGGRLDATNVVAPDVAVVTNVALDHVELLGHSLEAVAREKAGILKAGVPAVTAETAGGPLAVLRSRAAEVGTTLHELAAADVETAAASADTHFALDTATWGRVALRTPLLGAHQGRNAALAVRALDLLPPSIRPPGDALARGVAAVRWPGRLQCARWYGRTWLFDVAHNLAGVHALVAAIPALAVPRPLVVLVGVLGDKDWRGMLGPLHALADALVLTLPPTAPAERRWDPDAVLRAVALPAAIAAADFTDALDLAWWRAGQGGDGTVLVTGSFHTVGDALIALDRAPAGADVTLPRPSFAA
jgi:dihydrofolate synthase / folylpolyglutamate synthase